MSAIILRLKNYRQGDDHPEWNKAPYERAPPIPYIMFWLGAIILCLVFWAGMIAWVTGHQDFLASVLRTGGFGLGVMVTAFLIDWTIQEDQRAAQVLLHAV